MLFIGSIDFYDGDFELKPIQADNIVDANAKLRRYVVATYGKHLKEIDHFDIQSYSYVLRKLRDANI